LARKLVNNLEKEADENISGYEVTIALDGDFSRGSVSGGTLASVITMIETLMADP